MTSKRTSTSTTTAVGATVDYLPLWRNALRGDVPEYESVKSATTSVTDANVLAAIRLTRSVDATAEGKVGRYVTMHPALTLSTAQAQYTVGAMVVRVGPTITLAQGRAAYALSSIPETRGATNRKKAFDAILGADSDGLTGQPFGRLLVETYASVQAARKAKAVPNQDGGEGGEGSGQGDGTGAPTSTRTDSDRIKAALDALQPVIGRVVDGTIDDDGWLAFARMVTDLTKMARKAKAARPAPVDAAPETEAAPVEAVA